MSAMMNRIAHIDGLRAVAVLVVLAYHLKLPGFEGGFVGVDVFFVISGYVITRLIQRDVDAGHFSLRAFYAGRARRLFPALLVTVLLTGLGVFVLMAPVHASEAGWSAIAALFAWSNLYFWGLTGYFDTDALTKPLLHTWTLSVEWQFYAVWPVALLLALRSRAAPLWLGAIAALSLLANLAFQHQPTTIFYWMPFRVFEFATGALVLWLRPVRSELVATLLAVVAPAVLGFVVATYSGSMLFPSYNALPPVAAAALAIWAGGDSRFGRALLANPLAAYVGRISYSTYLVHWPLIVFFAYYTYRPPTTAEALLIGVMSLGLGAVLYHAVELPFWKGRVASLAIPVSAIAALTISALAYTATIDGWELRLSPEAAATASLSQDELRRLWGRSDCREPCEYGNLDARRTVLVMGDSHADHFARALLDRIGTETHFYHLHGGSCFFGADLVRRSADPANDGCVVANARKREWLPKVDVVVQAQRWHGYMDALDRDGLPVVFEDVEALFQAELDDLAKLYDGYAGKVIIVNATPSARLSCMARPTIVPMNCGAPDLETSRLFASMARQFIAERPNFAFVDPADYLCVGEDCMIVDDLARLLYVDDSGHLSNMGARRVVPFLANEIRRPLP
jgi:peptidoglycan/LPS O-acetylase OafA/YrhL